MASALQIVKQFFPQVKKVTDGAKPMEIEITDQDNKNSRVQDHNSCAMAVACKRKFSLDGVIISINRAYLIKGDKAVRYSLPGSVQREIVSFDRKAGFRTGKYQLSTIPPLSQIGVEHERGDKNSNKNNHSGKLKERFHHITDGIRTALGSKHAPAGITTTEGE